MKLNFFLFFLLVNILKYTIQQISISSPNELSKLFDYQPIKINFSNYGKIPYGFLFTGKLYYDLADKEHDYACKPLNPTHESYQNKIDRFPIIMVDRGNCSFVTKSRNVQNLGGSLALIADNQYEKLEDILMIDDGTGSDIFIPTVLISKTDGDKIKFFLQANKDNPAVLKNIILNIEFDMLQLYYVEFQFFMTSTSLQIYKLIKDVFKYQDFIFNYTQFTPHYITYKSPEFNRTNTDNINIPNCIAKGLYCSPPRYDLGIVDGRDVILEDIRQKCIYNIANNIYINPKFPQLNNSPRLYFEYMQAFFDKCLNQTEKNFNLKCSMDVIEKLNINYDLVYDCQSSSYIIDDKNKNILDLDNNNKILEEEKKIKSFYKIKILPTIMVNNKTLSGAWNSLNVLEAICSGFKNKPFICGEIIYNYTHENENKIGSPSLGFSTIFIIIVIVIMINIFIYLICKRYLNQRINDRIENLDINGRINSVVTNYISLKNTSGVN